MKNTVEHIALCPQCLKDLVYETEDHYGICTDKGCGAVFEMKSNEIGGVGYHEFKRIRGLVPTKELGDDEGTVDSHEIVADEPKRGTSKLPTIIEMAVNPPVQPQAAPVPLPSQPAERKKEGKSLFEIVREVRAGLAKKTKEKLQNVANKLNTPSARKLEPVSNKPVSIGNGPRMWTVGPCIMCQPPGGGHQVLGSEISRTAYVSATGKRPGKKRVFIRDSEGAYFCGCGMCANQVD